MAGNNFFIPTKQLWAAQQASPGRPKKKLVSESTEKLQIEAKSQIMTFEDFFKIFSEGMAHFDYNTAISLEILSLTTT